MIDNHSSKQPENQLAWNFEALFSKARLYSDKMREQKPDSREQMLFSCLTLELLPRATLSNVSPLLLIENSNWSHIYVALGFKPVEKKYNPRCISVSEIIKRLEKICPDFNQECKEFCTAHSECRNSEFHSGVDQFSQLKEVTWLPQYFRTVKILLSSMDRELSDFFNEEDVNLAKTMISAMNDDQAGQAKKIVSAHKLVLDTKSKSDQKTARDQGTQWAIEQEEHRTDCPSCNSLGVLYGEPASSRRQERKDDKIIETYEKLPTSFVCKACDLKISGLSKLVAIGLGGRFQVTEIFDFAEFYNEEG